MEEFVDKLLRQTVVEVCRHLKVTRIRRCVLDTLTELVGKYIEEIGLESTRIANMARRTKVNFHDMRAALESVGTDMGELLAFLEVSDQVRLSCAPHAFPVVKRVILCDPDPFMSEEEKRKRPSGNAVVRPPHVPEFLPSFPPEHSTQFTPDVKRNAINANELRKEQRKQNADVVKALVRMNKAVLTHLPHTHVATTDVPSTSWGEYSGPTAMKD